MSFQVFARFMLHVIWTILSAEQQTIFHSMQILMD